ncbi:MAG: S41 family peptidase [Flavobacteriaceae bacterium]|nr:S41 family peptidase [Flavobacteriaceae bacterium]
MKKFTYLLLWFCSMPLLQAQQSFVRQPALNADGSRLAFSYQGDIWTFDFNHKQYKRLTIHQGNDHSPVWNAEGNALVFSSNRFGNTNLFRIDANGGNLQQLTFYPSTDIAHSWNKDGKIVFQTKRISSGPEWDAQTYSISPAGGTPSKLIEAYGTAASLSPNGKFVAFVRGACRTSREDYEGPAQKDIWIYNLATKQYHQITNSNKNEHSPKWDEQNQLYYIGAASGRYNIYKQSLTPSGSAQGNPKALSQQTKNGVAEYAVSGNGTIFYHTLFMMYTIIDGKQTQLTLDLDTDFRFDRTLAEQKSGNISEFSLSPNGKHIAYALEGEIFVKKNDKEQKHSNNISKDAYRDRWPVWLDDKTLAFVSDRNGNFQIYTATSKDSLVGLDRSLSVQLSQISKAKEDISNLVRSPDGKKLAYRVGRAVLKIADIKDGKLKNHKTYSDSWASANGVSWSPDSKYIAYSQQDLDFDSEIFIQSISNPKEKINISMHPRSDSNPVWSADGKKLAFTSNRNGINYDVWMLWLQKADWEKTKTDHDLGAYHQKTSDKKKDKKDKKKSVKVQIDKDFIYDRLVQVTSLQDNEYNPIFDPSSEYLYFSATNPSNNRRGMFKVKWDGSKPKSISGTNDAYGFRENNGNLYFLKGGRMSSLQPKSDKTTSLAHLARYTVDTRKRNQQVFEEGIRALTQGFYDPQFHGYDWDTLVKKYKPAVLNTASQQDFSYAFNLLLGQLNASHMGYRSSVPETLNNQNIGLLGIETSHDYKGARIDYILPNSPADRGNVQLKVGDIIVAINGKKIERNTNFYSLFVQTANQEVLLELANGKEVVVRTTNQTGASQYQAWVATRKKLVEQYSKGQLGYIHIQGMNMTSFERFERELKASGYGKKGIVIDVRYNGGGWTTDRLMAVLNVTQHAYTVPRGAAKDLKAENDKFRQHYPFNERAILSVNTKPTVALCNETSYSNAEIFSHAFKSLKLGKLVGQPTFGAVISTGGHGLQNGYVRMPYRAWYVKESGLNMEHGPAVPDYLVSNPPGWKARGEDQQLQKAVEVLLEQIQ